MGSNEAQQIKGEFYVSESFSISGTAEDSFGIESMSIKQITGEGENEKANQYFSMFVYVILISGILLMMIGQLSTGGGLYENLPLNVYAVKGEPVEKYIYVGAMGRGEFYKIIEE